jgi:hypothetical protein
MDKTMMIRYGGRAAGAFAAWKLLKGKAPGGIWGKLALVAAGWLAGGLAADAVATKAGP